MSIKRETNNHRYPSHPYREKQELEELADARIITKNLVYIIGLSSSLADKNKLNKYEYLGQYGNIIKTVVNRNKAYNQNNIRGPSYSAYVTFSKPSEASIAILSLDNTMIDHHLIRASFGTTKYCSYYLKGIECSNKECLFLHKKAEENDIIKRGDLTSNKIIFAKQHEYAEKIADIYNPEVKKKILASKKGKTVFPSADSIYGPERTKKNKSENLANINNIGNKNFSKNNGALSQSKNSGNKYDNKYENSKENEEESYEEENEEEDEEENDEEEEEKMDDLSYDDSRDKSIKNKNNENNLKNQDNLNKKLILNKEKSRFDFVIKNENSDGIMVPKHILNLINKKINLYNLTKYMQQKVIDKIFLNESINNDNNKNNDEWIKFINDNIDLNNYSNNNKEYTNEIDNINHFIINKCAYHESKDNK